MGAEPHEVVRVKSQEDLEREETAERQEFLDKREYIPEDKKVNLGMKRCTRMKTSRRIVFPPGRGPREEAVMETRKGVWLETPARYMKEN